MPLGLGLMMYDRFPGGAGTTIITLTLSNSPPLMCGQAMNFFVNVRSSTGTPIGQGFVGLVDTISGTQLNGGFLSNGSISLPTELNTGTYNFIAIYSASQNLTPELIYNNLPDATSLAIPVLVQAYTDVSITPVGILMGDAGAESSNKFNSASGYLANTSGISWNGGDTPFASKTAILESVINAPIGLSTQGQVTFSFIAPFTYGSIPPFTQTVFASGLVNQNVVSYYNPYGYQYTNGLIVNFTRGNTVGGVFMGNSLAEFPSTQPLLPVVDTAVVPPPSSGTANTFAYGLTGIFPAPSLAGGHATGAVVEVQSQYLGEGHTQNGIHPVSFQLYQGNDTYHCKACSSSTSFPVTSVAIGGSPLFFPAGGIIPGITVTVSGFTTTPNSNFDVTVGRPLGYSGVSLDGSLLEFQFFINGSNWGPGGSFWVTDANPSVHIVSSTDMSCFTCPLAKYCCPIGYTTPGCDCPLFDCCPTSPPAPVTDCNNPGSHVLCTASICCDNVNTYTLVVWYLGNAYFQGGFSAGPQGSRTFLCEGPCVYTIAQIPNSASCPNQCP